MHRLEPDPATLRREVASIDNLRMIRDCRWRWLTRQTENRLVNPDRTGQRALADCAVAESGTVVWLKDYGLIRAFRCVAMDGEPEHWATNDLDIGSWSG